MVMPSTLAVVPPGRQPDVVPGQSSGNVGTADDRPFRAQVRSLARPCGALLLLVERGARCFDLVVPLASIDGFPFEVAASVGTEKRAQDLAARAASALDWHAEQLGWRPGLRLTVADGDDWLDVAPVPIYGLPQTWVDHTIIAAGDTPLFAEVAADLLAHAPPAMSDRLRETYGDPPILIGYFDQYLAHELVHLFCEQVPVAPAPLWIIELFCNLGMVGYLAECDPGALPLLRAAADASVHIPLRERPINDLADMERSFDGGQLAFGWYILRLTVLADRLWHSAGRGLYRAMYDRLLQADEPFDISDLEALHPAVEPAVGAWPNV